MPPEEHPVTRTTFCSDAISIGLRVWCYVSVLDETFWCDSERVDFTDFESYYERFGTYARRQYRDAKNRSSFLGKFTT
jgi:hypothetical protein